MTEQNEHFATLVEDVLVYAAIERLHQKPMNLVMLALGVGMTLALEKPEWARAAIDGVSSSERVVAAAQRLAGARAYVEAAEDASPAKGKRAR